uniref:Uncharacterized protein n=1 Tax=Cacopsylla melanoneura TaxID=428564 RepID=A0A8D9EJH1_9HEMI
MKELNSNEGKFSGPYTGRVLEGLSSLRGSMLGSFWGLGGSCIIKCSMLREMEVSGPWTEGKLGVFCKLGGSKSNNEGEAAWSKGVVKSGSSGSVAVTSSSSRPGIAGKSSSNEEQEDTLD